MKPARVEKKLKAKAAGLTYKSVSRDFPSCRVPVPLPAGQVSNGM
jgi:hypothetical protein